MTRHRPFAVRFWAKVRRSEDPEACWPWVGALSEKRAATWRGVIRYAGQRGRLLLAHRVALWLAEDPEGHDLTGYDRPGETLQACHRCHNRVCCNPAHLYWGTRADNDSDRYRRMAADVVRETYDDALS